MCKRFIGYIDKKILNILIKYMYEVKEREIIFDIKLVGFIC